MGCIRTMAQTARLSVARDLPPTCQSFIQCISVEETVKNSLGMQCRIKAAEQDALKAIMVTLNRSKA